MTFHQRLSTYKNQLQTLGYVIDHQIRLDNAILQPCTKEYYCISIRYKKYKYIIKYIYIYDTCTMTLHSDSVLQAIQLSP